MTNQLSKRLVLASSSPQRIKLLEQINIRPDLIISPDTNESPLPGELPKIYSIRMARQKALAVQDQLAEQQNLHSSTLILACDTVACMGRRILPKADSPKQVKECLELLSGRRHRVYSSVCLIDENQKIRLKTSLSFVKFKRLTTQEIEFYIDSKEGIGKAGGYAIQGLASMFINFISGSSSSIVGLPLYETATLLQSAGFLKL